MNLSKRVTLEQMTFSETAQRKQVLKSAQANPPQIVVNNMKHTAGKLELVMDNVGLIHITSGYRSIQLNKAVGGSSTSQHVFGEAVDTGFVTILESARQEVLEKAKSLGIVLARQSNNFIGFLALSMHREEWGFDQVIHEYGSKGNPAWVHFSSSATKANRGQMLVISSSGVVVLPKLSDAFKLGV